MPISAGETSLRWESRQWANLPRVLGKSASLLRGAELRKPRVRWGRFGML